MLFQVISLVGACLILGAYVANQRGWSGPTKLSYNLANLFGGLLLGWVAIVDRRVGFILLELVWVAVTIPPLMAALRGNVEQAS